MLKLLLMKFNQKISLRIFIISHILILTGSLIFLGWLYFVLYLEYKPSLSSLGERIFTQKPKTKILDLDQPSDDSLSFDSSILVSGKTTPNVEVLIFSDSQDLVVKSKGDGSFTANLDLDEGVNKIFAVTFDENGQSKSVERLIYYSKGKL